MLSVEVAGAEATTTFYCCGCCCGCCLAGGCFLFFNGHQCHVVTHLLFFTLPFLFLLLLFPHENDSQRVRVCRIFHLVVLEFLVRESEFVDLYYPSYEVSHNPHRSLSCIRSVHPDFFADIFGAPPILVRLLILVEVPLELQLQGHVLLLSDSKE